MIRSRSNPARMRRPWLLVPLLLAGWTVSAGAEWSHDPYENNPVLVGADHALDAVATTDGQGGMIVATLLSLETGGTALVAQRIDAQGDPVWNGTSGIAVFAQTGSYSAPVIVSDGNGGAYVGMSIVQSGYYHAFLQWIRNDGALPWGPSGVDLAPAAGAANQNRIALAAREIDGCIAAWDDARNDAGDVYAQHVTPAGTRLWGTSGLPIVNAVDFQGYVKTESDGFGGAYLIWRDARNYATNSHDIYAQHLTAGGTPDWTANGLAISAGSGSQFNPGVLSDEAGFVFFYYEDEAGGDDNIWVRKFTIRGDYWYSVMPCEEPTAENDPVLASDGRGGVYIAWCDYRDDGYAGKDIYAQWIDTSGAPRWTAGGVRIGATETNQYTPDICADGQGGAIISYRIPGGFFYQLYAQRLSSLGYRMWGSLGKLIASPPGGVAHVTLLADDRNGALMAWVDTRPGYYSDVYAQRIDYYGYLGDPAPQVTAVGDYPNDQGGRLIVDWSRSYLDTPEFDTIYDYSVWRRNAGATKRSDVEPSDEILARVVATTGLSPQDARAYLKSGWALEGELGAFHFEEYSYHAESYGDSTGAGIPLTECMVLAVGGGGQWQSNVLGGYSVDNLAPGVPLALYAAPAGTDIELGWTTPGSDAEDLAHYRIYRGDLPGFPLDEAHFLATAADTVFTDAGTGPGPFYYRVTALDIHGNEGNPSNEASAFSASAVGDAAPLATALRGNYPNPFNPLTSIQFELAATATVRLRVLDVAGRQVRTLLDGETCGPGRHVAVWNGLDDAGRRQASGAYFYRLETGDYDATRRMVLLK